MAFKLGEAIRDQTRSEGMTPRALEILQAAAKAAEAAGLASLDVVAAKGGGHKSHSAGTEWDLVGKNADGSLWSNSQRAQVAQGGRTGGADRFGLYEMGRGLGQGTLHVGYSHGGFQPAVWGASGLTSGSASRQFNNAADRTFLRDVESGKPVAWPGGKPPPSQNLYGKGGDARTGPVAWERGQPPSSRNVFENAPKPSFIDRLDQKVGDFMRFNPVELLANLGRGRAGVRSDVVPPSMAQPRQPTLREGMSGPQVKALQQDLIRAGLLNKGGDDGRFGPRTAAAVRSLEKNFNLPTQDRGIAGREVFGALRSGQMPPPVPQATPTQRTAPAATAPITPVERGPALNPPPIPPPSPTPSPTPPPTRSIEDALVGLTGAGKVAADSMAPLAGRVGGILGATAGAPNPPPAAPAIRPDFGQATPGQAPVARPGVGISPMANPAQFPTPTLPPQFGPNPPPAATQALGAQPAMPPISPGSGMLASQEARPSIRPDALGPPGGAANYAPRDIGALARGIESPMFNPPQSTPQFPATGWANAQATPPSSPQPGPTIAAANAAFGGNIPTIGAPTTAPPATTQREVPDEQRKAELEAAMQQRIDDMKAGLAGGFANPPLPSAGADMAPPVTGPAPGVTEDQAGQAREGVANALAGFQGTIPTIAPPTLESVVQPQVDHGGGQGILSGQGLGDQTQGEGPAAGKSDSGVLDAISEISLGGNQADVQPGGDNTGGTASGDNSSGQMDEDGLLAMLEEMFNQDNEMSSFR